MARTSPHLIPFPALGAPLADWDAALGQAMEALMKADEGARLGRQVLARTAKWALTLYGSLTGAPREPDAAASADQALPDILKGKQGVKAVINHAKLLGASGSHEQKIARLFGAKLRFTGGAPVFDLPLMLIAFTNRSGSTLLGDYLRQTGAVGGGGEFLNHETVAARIARQPVASFPDYIAALVAETCPKGRMLCVKAAWNQLVMLQRWNILAMFPAVRVVHIQRHDVIAQAVSLSIAAQTRRWTSTQATERPAVFRPKEIEQIISAQRLENEMIQMVTKVLDLPTIQLSYEQLCARPALHVQRVLSFHGVDLPDWRPKQPRLEQQADETNAVFVAQFRAILRDVIG